MLTIPRVAEEPTGVLSDHSSLNKPLRIFGTCLQWCFKSRGPGHTADKWKTSWGISLNFVIQQHHYAADLAHLHRQEAVPKGSALLRLTLFIHIDGLLRVDFKVVLAYI